MHNSSSGLCYSSRDATQRNATGSITDILMDPRRWHAMTTMANDHNDENGL
jgi:hypothetical protein